MVIIACIKLSGLHKTGNSFDCLWKQLFWTQIEACVAVMMVSFTAFRSVFVSHKAKPPRTMGSPGYVRHSRFWPYKRRLADDDSLPLAKKQQQADFHLTLGTQFRDARKKGIMVSHFEKDMESPGLGQCYMRICEQEYLKHRRPGYRLAAAARCSSSGLQIKHT